jgi:hypothetical protein
LVARFFAASRHPSPRTAAYFLLRFMLLFVLGFVLAASRGPLPTDGKRTGESRSRPAERGKPKAAPDRRKEARRGPLPTDGKRTGESRSRPAERGKPKAAPDRPCVGRSDDFLGYLDIYSRRLVTKEVVAPDWHRASRGPLPTDGTRPGESCSRPAERGQARAAPDRPCVGRSDDFLGYLDFYSRRLVTKEVVAPDWHRDRRGPLPTDGKRTGESCSRPAERGQAKAAPDRRKEDRRGLLPTDLASVEAMTSSVTWISIRDGR